MEICNYYMYIGYFEFMEHVVLAHLHFTCKYPRYYAQTEML